MSEGRDEYCLAACPHKHSRMHVDTEAVRIMHHVVDTAAETNRSRVMLSEPALFSLQQGRF